MSHTCGNYDGLKLPDSFDCLFTRQGTHSDWRLIIHTVRVRAILFRDGVDGLTCLTHFSQDVQWLCPEESTTFDQTRRLRLSSDPINEIG